METSLDSEFAGATVLSTVSNSRVNVLASHEVATRLYNNENVNPRPWETIPLEQQVADFFARPRTGDQTVFALKNRSDDFVAAMLDVLERSAADDLPWASPVTLFLLWDFGWKLTNVLSRDSVGKPDRVTIVRPGRAVEQRARRRSKARRARGIASPIPSSVITHQVAYFLSYADEEEVISALRSLPANFVAAMLEKFEEVTNGKSVLYWTRIPRILLDEYDWIILSGSVYANGGPRDRAGLVSIAPPSKPNRRQRAN